MAPNNSDPTISLPPDLCDYCHQRPKFPPYEYCGRTCGALAAAAGNQTTKPVVMCKNCNQRPVYQNHQFCGKNCASVWTATHGQINTGSLLGSWPPLNPNQQTVRSGSQPGQSPGGIKGFVKGFKNFISPANQTQQQQLVANSAQTRQPPKTTSDPTGTLTTATPTTGLSPGAPQHPFSVPSPINWGTSIQNNNNRVGPFNGASPILPPPIHPTSSGSSVPQSPNSPNLDPWQPTQNAVSNGVTLPSYSAGSLRYTPEPDNSLSAEPIPVSHPDREPSENGGGGDEGDEVIVGDVEVQSIGSFVYPPSVPALEVAGICRLEGCPNPTFVDSITDLESEYCSRKHQEEAMVSKQAALCIMCHKTPRGSNDHFCSVECRTRALRS